MNVYESLKSCDVELIKSIAEHLNRYGSISDEDEFHIQSVMMENWIGDCTNYLREYGYIGGNLRCIGRHFDGYGSAYVLYDEDNSHHNDAIEYLMKLVQSKL